MYPGEALFRSQAFRSVAGTAPVVPVGDSKPLTHVAKQNVWSMYTRSQQLYSSCLAVRYDNAMADSDKVDYAAWAWSEMDAIERMLNSHTCDVEDMVCESKVSI